MEGRVKQLIVGVAFVLSVSAVSGAVTYSQMRGGDEPPGKKEAKKVEVADEPVVVHGDDSPGEAPVTEAKPASSPGNGGGQGLGQALGFGADGDHPGHQIGQGHQQHGNGRGRGHDHHDDDPPPVSPADPGHHGHGHGHDHHGNGHGFGHDHHDD